MSLGFDAVDSGYCAPFMRRVVVDSLDGLLFGHCAPSSNNDPYPNTEAFLAAAMSRKTKEANIDMIFSSFIGATSFVRNCVAELTNKSLRNDSARNMQVDLFFNFSFNYEQL